MNILSGLIKEKVYKKIANGYKLISRYTDSSTVNMPDGNTATTNLGAIKGLTASLNVTVPGYAADATTVAELNSNLGNCFVDSTKITQEITFPYIANRDVILAGDVWLKNGDSRVGFDVNGNRIHNYRNQTPGDMQMPVFIALKKGNVLNIGYTMGSYTTHINEW